MELILALRNACFWTHASNLAFFSNVSSLVSCLLSMLAYQKIWGPKEVVAILSPPKKDIILVSWLNNTFHIISHRISAEYHNTMRIMGAHLACTRWHPCKEKVKSPEELRRERLRQVEANTRKK